MNEYSSVDTNGGGAVSRTYNENGNLTQDGSASVDGTKKFFYDAFNRLVRVEERQSGTFVTIAEYAYDAESRRVRRHVQNSGVLNETVVYYYLGGRVLEETDGSGSEVRQYVWGGEGLLQTFDGGTRYYVHENGYGSVIETTDDGLESQWDHFDYDVYGVVANTGTASGLPYGFRGCRLDPESVFLLGGSTPQYYDPSQGRGISRGPGAFLNLYAWGGNHPLSSSCRSAMVLPARIFWSIPEGTSPYDGRTASSDPEVRRRQIESDDWGCTGLNKTRFNCGGYAFGTNTWMGLLDAARRLVNRCKLVECSARCRPGERKFWIWTWDSNVYLESWVGPDGKPKPGVRPIPQESRQDYHVVSHPAEADEAYSKTGTGPIQGPKPPSDWAPSPEPSDAGTAVLKTGQKIKLVRLRENIMERCFCCPGAQ